jgi:hypothetical protein
LLSSGWQRPIADADLGTERNGFVASTAEEANTLDHLVDAEEIIWIRARYDVAHGDVVETERTVVSAPADAGRWRGFWPRASPRSGCRPTHAIVGFAVTLTCTSSRRAASPSGGGKHAVGPEWDD